jgi:hypothetical protein
VSATRLQFEDGVLLVACPYCDAPSGEVCRRSSGAPVGQFPHQARRYEAALAGHITMNNHIPPRSQWFKTKARWEGRGPGKSPFSARFPLEMLARLKRMAAEREIPENEIVTTALAEYLDKHDPDPSTRNEDQ